MTKTDNPAGAHRRPPRMVYVLGALALLVVALLGYIIFGPGAKDSSGVIGGQLTYLVKKGDLRISFMERGNVKSAKSVPIYSRLESEHTIVSLVPEGSNVKEGDVLVELDASELTQQMNQQQIVVDTAAADYLQAEEMLEIQRSLCESDIQKAELDRTLSELDLQRYESEQGEYALSIMKAQADVTIGEQELKRAQNTLEWTDKLAEKGYVSGTELIADRLAEKKATIQLEQALGSLKLLKDFTHKKDQAKYDAAFNEAKSAFGRAQRKSRATLAQYEAAKRGKDSTLNLSKKRLAKISDQLEKATIRAPQDGMVVYPNVEPWRRERMIMAGSQVHENQLLMNLPDVSAMAVDVQVHESWVDQVKEGLPALVSIDAVPNLGLKGNVSKVGLLPDSVNRWLNPDLKVYATEITIDDSPDVKLLRPGMSAKVEILIAVLNGVLFVPVQSVSTIDKQQVCYALEGSELVPRTVKCGKFNDSFIEILSGLKEGDVIQLNAPAPKGTKNRESEKEMEALAKEIEAAGSKSAGPTGSAGPGGPPGNRGGDGERSKGKGGGSRRKGAQDETGPKPAVLKEAGVQGGGAQ